jgi:glutathione S-transferase
MAIKLHYHPLSTYSRRVRIALAEKQIPHELVVVDMPARRHREEPYLSLNPYGRVPTLEEDGFVLYESTAILNYLEAARPSPPLAPADARGRALVDMHMKLCDLQLSRHAGTIMFPKRFLPKESGTRRRWRRPKARSRSISRSSTNSSRARPIWSASSSRSPRSATSRSSTSCR